jgi:hypothetical protein
MSTSPLVERDERTVAVENASYRLAYAVLTFALLVDVMYRGLFRNEAAWDLMALVIGGGAICTVYQVRQKTLARGWMMKAVLVAVISAVVAAVAAYVLAITR